ncbi:MAG: methyltransferase domain-containing protein [Bacteroidota bacterium]
MIAAKHLQLILAIDELGSLSRASQKLNLTQSALSHQLKKLEEQLDLLLFHRIDNQLFFTEAGKALRDSAKSILEKHENLEQRLKALKKSQLFKYIHGYSPSETQRLLDQATSVADFIHYDSVWPEGTRVLEVGCGVGAQTEIITRKNPQVNFVSIDLSEHSLNIAKEKMEKLGISNVQFRQQDARTINTKDFGKFDHLFICFLLEHLNNPMEVLQQLKGLLKKGGSITVIEGDHGSTFFYPDNHYARKVVQAQVDLQKKRGGNANIGRELFPLLTKAGYQVQEVSPRQIYVDASKPNLVKGFIKNTFTAMIQGMSEDIIAEKVLSSAEVQLGIKGLLDTADLGGTFSYTFFKAKAKLS